MATKPAPPTRIAVDTEALEAEFAGREMERLRKSAGLCISGTMLFFLADVAVAPQAWRGLLALRIVTSLSLGLVLAWTYHPAAIRGRAHIGSLLLGLMGTSTVGLAVLAGGQAANYHQPLALILLGYGMLVPTTVGRGAMLCGLHVVLYSGSLMALGIAGDRVASSTQAMVLATAALMACFFAAIRNGLHRREFAALRRLQLSQQHLQVSHHDLQQSVQAQEETHLRLAVAHQKLKASQEARSHFFANASHELRTPLTLIIAAIESMQGQEVSPADDSRGVCDEHIEICRRNGLRLLRLVDDILELVSLEHETPRLRREPVGLGRMLTEIAEEVGPYARRRKLALRCDVPAGCEAQVSADKAQVERVVLTLVSHAIKYSRDGGSITLSLHEDPQEVCVEVSDTGEGMAQEALTYIFGPENQPRDGGGPQRGGGGGGGGGIGLALARRLVEAQQGSMSASSELGVGTTLSFRLPRQPTVAPAAASATAGATPAASATTQLAGEPGLPVPAWDAALRQQPAYRLMAVEQASARREAPVFGSASGGLPLILLVDDSLDTLALLASILAAAYRVRQARHGEEALQLAESAPPDLIICGLMGSASAHLSATKPSGMDVLRSCRKSAALGQVPFVLLTTYGQVDERIAGIEQGASANLVQPFRNKEVLVTVQRLLGDRLRQARVAAKQRETGLRVMADGIAHEVLNPLGFVSNGLFLLRSIMAEAVDLISPEEARAGALRGEAEDFFGSAEEGLARAQGAINSLREFARSGAAEAPRPQPANPAIVRALAMMQGRGRVEEMLVANPWVNLPVGQLEQVVLNLLLNVVEAGGDSCPIRVETSLVWAAGSLALRVADEGPGMAPDILAKIFEPYFTTKDKSTGLGLAMCQKFVHAAGGHISAESTPGEGTRVTVLLPLASPSAAAAQGG